MTAKHNGSTIEHHKSRNANFSFPDFHKTFFFCYFLADLTYTKLRPKKLKHGKTAVPLVLLRIYIYICQTGWLTYSSTCMRSRSSVLHLPAIGLTKRQYTGNRSCQHNHQFHKKKRGGGKARAQQRLLQ